MAKPIRKQRCSECEKIASPLRIYLTKATEGVAKRQWLCSVCYPAAIKEDR